MIDYSKKTQLIKARRSTLQLNAFLKHFDRIYHALDQKNFI